MAATPYAWRSEGSHYCHCGYEGIKTADTGSGFLFCHACPQCRQLLTAWREVTNTKRSTLTHDEVLDWIRRLA